MAQKLLLWLPLRRRCTAVDRLVGPRRGHLPPEFEKIAISVVDVVVVAGVMLMAEAVMAEV